MLSLVLAGSATALGVGIGVRRADPAAAQATPSFVGSWIGTFTRSDGMQLGILMTVHENGTLLSALSDHLAGTSSHGTWMSTGANQYAYSQTRLDVDAAGNFAGWRTIDADVSLDPSGDAWTQSTRISFYDPSGIFLRSVTSTGTGTRIPVVRTTDTRPQMFPASMGGS
jgi:hypothetical protein